MDIATALGLVAGMVVITTMVLMGGDLHMFISEHAIIIIFGGSFAATLIRFPLATIMHGLPMGASYAFKLTSSNARDLVDEIAGLAEIARKSGPVGLEKVTPADPFLANRPPAVFLLHPLSMPYIQPPCSSAPPSLALHDFSREASLGP